MTHPSPSAPTFPPPGLIPTRRRFASARTVISLMLREMATTYGRSAVGYLWAILEPVGGIILLTVVFSVAFHAPPLGVNFPIFYATGFVPFTLYLTISNKMGQSLQFSRALLAYPTVTFVDALLARFLVNFITQLMVAYIVFATILLAYDTRTILDLPPILNALAMAAAFGFGVGVANAFLLVRFPAWQQVWSILNRPLFIISCIFFTFETIPQPYRDYLWYNPLVHVIGTMRAGFYPGYRADYVSALYVYGLSLALVLFGLVFLRRYYRELIDR